jgi:hypothetical protein
MLHNTVHPQVIALGLIGRIAIAEPDVAPKLVLMRELNAAGGKVPAMARRLKSTRMQVAAALEAMGIKWRKKERGA